MNTPNEVYRECLITFCCLFVIFVANFLVAESHAQAPFEFSETFEDFAPARFQTKIPNKNTQVRDGVLWTRGESNGKYPPMVYLGVEGNDLDISFRYRHLESGGMVWFFVDGDDGFGSVDHMLRVKLNRNGVQLQVDVNCTFESAISSVGREDRGSLETRLR